MNWLRILIGGVAIAASIFLAFEINAWRQDRGAALEEQQVLQDLKEEFNATHNALTQYLAEQLRTLESLENLLSALENASPQDFAPIIDSALLEMTTPVTWDRSEEALSALLNSEQTDFLASSTLRTNLSAWEGVFGEFIGDQEIANKMVYDTHIPYFVSKNVLVAAGVTVTNDDQSTMERSISNDPDAIKRLLEDPNFHVLVNVRYRFKEHLIVEIEIAIAAADAILADVQDSLN